MYFHRNIEIGIHILLFKFQIERQNRGIFLKNASRAYWLPFISSPI